MTSSIFKNQTIMDNLRNKAGYNFLRCVKGYHMLNNSPITGTCWEDINATVLNASDCPVLWMSNGSHKPGKDMDCRIEGLANPVVSLSNKSTKYFRGNRRFKISSYRLGTICSETSPGEVKDIVKGINDKKNFEFYSVLARSHAGKEIHYDWYLIPSDLPALDPSTYEWHLKYKKNGDLSGWETNIVNGSSMFVNFTMSSELWINLTITDDVKKFIVGSCDANTVSRMNYIDFYEKTVDNLPLTMVT